VEPAEHAPSGPPAPADSRIRLAVIDSDSGFLQVVGNRLLALGWPSRVLASPVPIDALAMMRVDVVVVDPAVLGPLGWSYLGELCGGLPEVGVIVCAGRSSVAQRVRGLRMGVDDWVTKPCHPDELVARLEAVVRRHRRMAAPQAPLRVGELELRRDLFQVFANGGSAELTRREYELMLLLVEAAGEVLERDWIYQRVWGYEMARGERSVDVYVRKLRAKLARVSPGWRYIHTHFRVGYRLEAEAPSPARSRGRHGKAEVGAAAIVEPAAQGYERGRAHQQRHPEQDDAIEQHRGGGRRRGDPVDDQRADQAAVDAAEAGGEGQRAPELADQVRDQHDDQRR
jgi:DNA-binding response OmpR family regulator